jgi:hypothetical protein
MASTSQKLNYSVTDNKVGRDQGAGQVQNVPKRLPVSVVSIDKTNSIITLKFETDGMPYTLPNVTVPLSGPEYIRYPIKPQMMMQQGDQGGSSSGGQGQGGQGQMQPGDFGFVTSADSNIGNMSGLGPSTPANFTLPANLAPLIFTLMGNKNWTPHDDQTALMGYAPTGTIHRDTNKKAKHIVHPTNGITSQTGAQGQTGPTSNPTYNIQHLLHPLNGLLSLIKDQSNGDHMLSIVPKGGSGVIGMLLSVFGGKHKHQIDDKGHTITTSSNVNIQAVTHNINALTNISKLLKTTSIAQLTNYIKF